MTTDAPPADQRPLRASRIRGPLLRYRTMAYVTGTLLIVLTVAVIWKYTAGGTVATDVTTVVGIAHGWLFIIYLLTVLDLGIRARLSWWRLIAIGACGTIPVLTFVAERYTVHRIAQRLH